MHTYELMNGTSVTLPAPVWNVLQDSDKYYILLDSTPPDTITDNVLCYSDAGQLLWRIEDVMPQKPNTFDVARIRRDGSLEVFNTDGVWIKVDKQTGRAVGYRTDRMGPSSESDTNVFKPISWRE